MFRSCAISLVFILILAASCKNSNYSDFGPFGNERELTEAAWVVRDEVATEGSWNSVSGEAPLSMGMIVASSIPEKDEGRRLDQVIDRMELDFGDGTGWQDVTALHYMMDFVWDDGVDLNGLARHVYSEPGEYIIRARATFWDGEVITLDENTPTSPGKPRPIVVTVLEPTG